MLTDFQTSILLIEDDDVDAENVRRSLPGNTNIQRATTLKIALETIGETPIDLVLLDPGLPDCSGVETFRRIRDSAPQTPIVILTGLQDKDLALKIIRQGAQDYLLKNQLDDRAIQAIRFALERQRMLQQLEEEQAERERLAVELREREQSLAHLGRVALMGELVAEITHEVSQPLNVISTLTGALKASFEKRESPHESDLDLVNKLNTANAHAGEVLRRLRQFIRNESTTFESFDMNELIESTVEFVDYERRQRKVDIKLELNETTLLATGNRTQIQQVIVNLLRNSFDAMSETPETDRQVTIRAYPHDSVVRIEVSDRGPGLELDKAEAFSPFKTTKTSGLGMGLAICSRILHNHNGEITALPREGPGAVFQFEIPNA